MTVNPNFRPRREHRRADHVGKLRQRLAKAIVQAFADQGVTVRCDPAKLYPALGRWRSDFRMDVYRWEGSIELMVDGGGWLMFGIQSWNSMSKCIKGFTVWRDGPCFDVGAIEPGCSPTERYVYEG
jgi:hypothetical protein